jgi:hypothetical protein
VTDDFRSKWGLLGRADRGRVETFPVRELGHRSVRLATDDAARRHLLVPVTNVQHVLPPSGEAIAFELRPLAIGEDTGMTLDIACLDGDVHEEFDLLIEDVIDRVTTLQSAADETLRAIERWRKLFSARRGRLFTVIEQMGLMAELRVLDRALATEPHSIASWRGPFKEPHDFEFPGGCVEVKAIGGDLQHIEIHGLHQLDPHRDVPLRLVLLEVIQDAAGMDVVQYAKDIADRHDVELVAPFNALGLDLDDPPERLSAFSVGENVRIVPVTEAVPRLVPAPGTADDDISAVRFRIRIGSLLQLIAPEQLEDVLVEVANAG